MNILDVGFAYSTVAKPQVESRNQHLTILVAVTTDPNDPLIYL